MPRKKDQCSCGRQKLAIAALCRPCRDRRPYERTNAHREKMSAALEGKPHSWRSASTRPDVADKIRSWWTPARRRAAKARGDRFAHDRAWRDLIARSVTGTLNPRYRGKGNTSGYAPGWGRLHRRLIRERAGNRCEICSRETRLDIHHK